METGRCYYRDEEGLLWVAISYCDETGTVTTIDVSIDEGAA